MKKMFKQLFFCCLIKNMNKTPQNSDQSFVNLAVKDTLHAAKLNANTLSVGKRTIKFDYTSDGSSLTINPPPAGIPNPNSYLGSRLTIDGFLYEAGTLPAPGDCVPFADPCGVIVTSPPPNLTAVPQFPDKLIGKAYVEGVIINNAIAPYLDAVFAGDFATAIAQAELLAGVPLLTGTFIFNFNPDRQQVSQDSLIVQGINSWGVSGQVLPVSVQGGTGNFASASGEATLTRIVMANQSGLESFKISVSINNIV